MLHMDAFENNLNAILVDTFNYILKYEEMSLQKIANIPITITEAHMIEAVGKQENQEVTVSRLASLLTVAIPTATIAVKKLERKGLLKKVPCEKDGRRTIISLTDTGKVIERAHRLFHEKMVRSISRQYVDSEKEILLKAVKTLSEFFGVRVEA
jgi:DNA-binding MarR family transcriptional regulator